MSLGFQVFYLAHSPPHTLAWLKD